MKKILLALLTASSVSSFALTTTSTSLTINGTITGACTTSLGVSTVTLPPLFYQMPGNSSGFSALTVGCTAGQTFNLDVSSVNGFQLVNGSDAIAYYIGAALVGGSPYTVPSLVSNWNASSMGAAHSPVFGTGNTVQTTDTGDAFILNLTPTVPVANVTESANAGTYTDTVTIYTNY